MARQIGDGSNSITFPNIIDPNAGPLTCVCWALADSFSSSVHIIKQQDGSAGRTWLAAKSISATYVLQSFIGLGATNGSTDISGRTGEWLHTAVTTSGAGAGSTIKVHLDGEEDGNSSRNPEAETSGQHIVGKHKSVFQDEWFGRLAEFALWDVELVQNEMRMLAAGVSPVRVRPSSLQIYLPMYGLSDPEPDFSGKGITTTVTGTSQGDHAPVAPSFGFDTGWMGAFTEVAAGGLSIPVAIHSYRQRHQSWV